MKTIPYKETIIAALVAALLVIIPVAAQTVVAAFNRLTRRLDHMEVTRNEKLAEIKSDTTEIKQRSAERRATDTNGAGDTLPDVREL